MAVQVKIGKGAKTQFIAEIVTRPAIIHLKPRTGQLMPPLIIGVIFTVVGYLAFNTGASNEGLLSMPSIVALIFAAIGAMNIALSVRNLRRGDEIRFLENHIEVIEKQTLGATKWQANYREFTGVRHRTKQAEGSKSTTPYQIIELVHPDETKTLPLYAVKADTKPIDHLDHYADVLDMRIIQ